MTVFKTKQKALEPESRYMMEVKTLKQLCQIMFDPENQPPQISTDEAWENFKEIEKGE